MVSWIISFFPTWLSSCLVWCGRQLKLGEEARCQKLASSWCRMGSTRWSRGRGQQMMIACWGWWKSETLDPVALRSIFAWCCLSVGNPWVGKQSKNCRPPAKRIKSESLQYIDITSIKMGELFPVLVRSYSVTISSNEVSTQALLWRILVVGQQYRHASIF